MQMGAAPQDGYDNESKGEAVPGGEEAYNNVADEQRQALLQEAALKQAAQFATAQHQVHPTRF